MYICHSGTKATTRGDFISLPVHNVITEVVPLFISSIKTCLGITGVGK